MTILSDFLFRACYIHFTCPSGMIYFQHHYDKLDHARLSRTRATFFFLSRILYRSYAQKTKGLLVFQRIFNPVSHIFLSCTQLQKQGEGWSSSCTVKNSSEQEWAHLEGIPSQLPKLTTHMMCDTNEFLSHEAGREQMTDQTAKYHGAWIALGLA